jgi:hypothetical protein
MTETRSAELERLYTYIGEFSRRQGGLRQLGHCTASMGWPARGVYFLFEPGETRWDGSPRVVRVGTHGLNSGSRSTLWGRLRQHRGRADGEGGNHRASILRLHVGAALIRAGDWPPGLLAAWLKPKSDAAWARLETAVEVLVSTHIGNMAVVCLPLDRPDERRPVERNSIALLTGADPPSSTWLGLHAVRPEIAGSGLWNVTYVGEKPEDDWEQPFQRALGGFD